MSRKAPMLPTVDVEPTFYPLKTPFLVSISQEKEENGRKTSVSISVQRHAKEEDAERHAVTIQHAFGQTFDVAKILQALDRLDEVDTDADALAHVLHGHADQLPDYYKKLCTIIEEVKTLLRPNPEHWARLERKTPPTKT